MASDELGGAAAAATLLTGRVSDDFVSDNCVSDVASMPCLVSRTKCWR